MPVASEVKDSRHMLLVQGVCETADVKENMGSQNDLVHKSDTLVTSYSNSNFAELGLKIKVNRYGLFYGQCRFRSFK